MPVVRTYDKYGRQISGPVNIRNGTRLIGTGPPRIINTRMSVANQLAEMYPKRRPHTNSQRMQLAEMYPKRRPHTNSLRMQLAEMFTRKRHFTKNKNTITTTRNRPNKKITKNISVQMINAKKRQPVNNINRAYMRYGKKLNNSYNQKKMNMLRKLNSLPFWNTRRHNRNPNKVAFMIWTGKILN